MHVKKLLLNEIMYYSFNMNMKVWTFRTYKLLLNSDLKVALRSFIH